MYGGQWQSEYQVNGIYFDSLKHQHHTWDLPSFFKVKRCIDDDGGDIIMVMMMGACIDDGYHKDGRYNGDDGDRCDDGNSDNDGGDGEDDDINYKTILRRHNRFISCLKVIINNKM